MSKNPRLIDMSGKRYAMWTVHEQAGNTSGGGALWRCTCDCGNERVVLGADIRKGKSRNCGCTNRPRLGNMKRTHGESSTRLHNIWTLMLSRCRDTSNPTYGGRGISVCQEWTKYETFRDWALANGYSKKLSIERVDVDGNYCPENCTWADAATQSANRRYTNKAPDGELWLHKARKNGITGVAFRQRYLAGWPMEQAISWPMNTERRKRARNAKGQFA